MARSTETSVDIVVSDKVFRSLMLARNADKSQISTISGDMGEREREAAENKHLHLPAYKQVAKLAKMDELKRNDFLRSFTVYVDKAKRLKLFGEEHAGDMGDLADRPDADEPVSNGDAGSRTVHANGIKQLEPKAAKNGKGVGAAPGSYRAVHTRNN